jgi:tetratricopeptide (TPR) repeat protein
VKTQPAATLEPVAPAGARSRVQRYAPWLLLAAGIVTYANSLSSPFIFDDVTITRKSPHLHTLWPPWRTMFAPPNKPDSGRPVVTLSLLVNYALGGEDVRGYHVLNVAVHILAGLALYGVMRRTLLGPALRARFAGSADWIALATALLWLVHPLQTECINYVYQRSESMMGLFYLLTLYCAIRAAQSDRRWTWRLAAVAACALGMASKEAMVTAPIVVVFYDWAFRSELFSAVWRKRWPLYAGLGGTWAVLAALTASGPRTTSVGFGLGISAMTYALDQCLIVPRYLRLAFWPHPLVLDYGEAHPVAMATALPYAIGLALLLVAVAIVCWRRPRLGFPAAWVFLLLAPTSTVVPIASEVGAERRMYLPLAGIIVLAVIGVHELLRRVRAAYAARAGRSSVSNYAGTMLVAAATVALSVISVARNQAYHDPEELWTAVTRERPQNRRAFCWCAASLAKHGRLDEAVQSYLKALAISPNYYDANYGLANTLRDQGQIGAAIRYYRKALATAPTPLDRAGACNDLGRVLLQAGQAAEGLQLWREAARLKPDEAGLLNNLAWQLATQADAALRNGREAVELAERACELSGHKEAGYLDTLAAAYAEAGRFGEAVKAAEAACELFPPAEAAEARTRLELYRQSKPYRQGGN